MPITVCAIINTYLNNFSVLAIENKSECLELCLKLDGLPVDDSIIHTLGYCSSGVVQVLLYLLEQLQYSCYREQI